MTDVHMPKRLTLVEPLLQLECTGEVTPKADEGVQRTSDIVEGGLQWVVRGEAITSEKTIVRNGKEYPALQTEDYNITVHSVQKPVIKPGELFKPRNLAVGVFNNAPYWVSTGIDILKNGA